MRSRRVGVALMAAGASLLAGSAAEAALPPWYDRLEQFQTVLAQAGGDIVTKLQPHGLMDRLGRQPDGTFKAWAGKCHVVVTLTALQPGGGGQPIPGKTTYRAAVGKPVCN